MQIISEPVQLMQLWHNRQTDLEELLKIVIDVRREVIAVDAEMHADLEIELLADGSQQEDLWGANIYSHQDAGNRLEFTSFINIRPGQGNRSMEIISTDIRDRIVEIVNRLLIL